VPRGGLPLNQVALPVMPCHGEERVCESTRAPGRAGAAGQGRAGAAFGPESPRAARDINNTFEGERIGGTAAMLCTALQSDHTLYYPP